MTRRLQQVPVDKIRVPKETLRNLDAAWAEVLGGMMAQAGQAQPIEVGTEKAGFVLVFGLHRLVGARLQKFETIDALVDDAGGDDAARRRRAVEENLIRRELSYLDRAVHISELRELTKADTGERRGGDRRSAAFQKSEDRTFGLLDDLASKVGFSRSTVAEAVKVAQGIGRAVRQRIVSTPALARLADSRIDLLALAARDAGDQAAILELIGDGASKVASVPEAIAFLDGVKSESDTEKWRRRVHTGLTKLTQAGRFALFDEIEADIRAWARKRDWRP